ERVSSSLRGIAPGKVVAALGNYGYDWHDGHADALTVGEAWLAAHDSDTKPTFVRAAGNAGFAYADEAGHHHDVWLQDAVATWNQLLQLRRMGVQNIGLWRMGSEDPG